MISVSPNVKTGSFFFRARAIYLIHFPLALLQAELQSIKDASSLQKKRTTEMMISLLKDLSEIGMSSNYVMIEDNDPSIS